MAKISISDLRPADIALNSLEAKVVSSHKLTETELTKVKGRCPVSRFWQFVPESIRNLQSTPVDFWE